MTELKYDIDSVLARFEAADWLDRYWQLLSEENKKVNLVSRETNFDTFRRLVAEALLPFGQISRKFDSYLDIGAGGGIPSVPVLLSGQVQGESVLYERTIKKTAALERILRGLNIKGVSVAAESFGERPTNRMYSLITLSYVMLTPPLWGSIRAHLAEGGVFVYYSKMEIESKGIHVRHFSYSHTGQGHQKHFSILTK